MYAFGKGVPQDDKEANKWFRLAPDGGVEMQKRVGNKYYIGDDTNEVPQDDKEAIKWYRLAAEQGDAEAQYSLGAMYGLGASNEDRQDLVEAYKWYRLAAEQGYPDAKAGIKLLQSWIRTPPPRRHGNQKIREQVKSLKLYMKQEESQKEVKKKKEKAEQTAKFNRWMVEAENYRSLFKESRILNCADSEKPSQCITGQSCWIAAIILENMHDDRIKQFKKTVDGGLLSKGNLDKAMKELKKHMDKDKFLKEKIEQLFMQCAFGSFPLSGFVDSFQR